PPDPAQPRAAGDRRGHSDRVPAAVDAAARLRGPARERRRARAQPPDRAGGARPGTGDGARHGDRHREQRAPHVRRDGAPRRRELRRHRLTAMDDTTTPGSTRLERDTFGDIAVPADRLWGAQTQRSLQNFRISGERQPMELIRALALVKRAAAQVNAELGALPADLADAI